MMTQSNYASTNGAASGPIISRKPNHIGRSACYPLIPHEYSKESSWLRRNGVERKRCRIQLSPICLYVRPIDGKRECANNDANFEYLQGRCRGGVPQPDGVVVR